MTPAAATVADLPELARWWAAFCATGELPAELPRQQGRLVRAVHRGQLPSGPVFVKVMAFPRGKDRLRYLLRELPGEHEARLLAAVAAAGIPCPQVVACRTARRTGLPHRSMLVLRALPVVADGAGAEAARWHDAAAMVVRLLQAGIEHRDLHAGNFVRLVSGELAVLDLQSAAVRGRDLTADPRVRCAAAVRMLQDVDGDRAAAAAELLRVGLLRDAAEVADAVRRAERAQQAYWRGRVLRCLQDGTEFTWRWRWWGREHRLRDGLGPGRWWTPPAPARALWIGQREQQLVAGRPPFFRGCATKWWWLGGGGALYVPAGSDERIQAEVQAALAGWGRFLATVRGRHPEAM